VSKAVSKNNIRISVVFSSFNGEGTLPAMLDSLVNMRKQIRCIWELIIVNNNSDDNTQKILGKYTDLLPLKVINECRPGKNISLNRALEYVHGELIIFTDDDVIVDPDWLNNYELLMQQYPDVVVFGGAISPFWLEKPDAVLLKQIPIGIAFAVNHGNFENGYIEPDKLWGPNMAIQRQLFDKGLRFDETIGPSGSNYAMGSETDILMRIKLDGGQGFFSNDIKVQHIIRKHQLSLDWLKGRAFRAGRGELRSQLRVGNDVQCGMILGYPRWVVKLILILWVKVLMNKVFGKRLEKFDSEWRLRYLQGYAQEYKNVVYEKN